MFKTLSGLGGTDLKIEPSDFTKQWDHLLEEVLSVGDGDYWQMTHPFPPLRMKAMSLYWDANDKPFSAGSSLSADKQRLENSIDGIHWWMV